jgi:hypothetical protein
MPITRTPNGRWKVDTRAAGRGSRRIVRTFDLKKDAEGFYVGLRRKKQLGEFYRPDDVTLAEFFETYWEFRALHLEDSTRKAYRSAWLVHLRPRLGGYHLREITPSLVGEFHAQLTRAGVGAAVAKKAHAVLQAVLSHAVLRGLVEFNAAQAVPRSDRPRYARQREPHIFTPPAVEALRTQVTAASATMISLLAYSGPRRRALERRRLAQLASAHVAVLARQQRSEVRSCRHRGALLALWRPATDVGRVTPA